jgi:hypothetical protein
LAAELLAGSPEGVGYLLKDRVAGIFAKLGLEPSGNDNRRVLAAIKYLES